MSEESGVLRGKQTGPSHYGAIDNPQEEGTSNADAVEIIYVNPKGFEFVKYKLREAFAELLGTFVFITFGLGSIAQAKLGEGGFGNWITISFGFGFGLAFGLFVSGSVSGGHLNPAVTITLAAHRNFAWHKVPIYILAQLIGAFLAAVVIFSNYHAAILEFDGGKLSVTGSNATAGIFATYPQEFMSIGGAFFSEFIGTFFLLLIILAATDERNLPNTRAHFPFIIGLTLTTIAISLGYETGFSLNGARDFGPRLFTFIAGYGVEVFSAYNFYFWIPLVAPILGGLFAGIIYDLLIYWGKSPVNSLIGAGRE
ncbi:aquaporin-like protein [Gigaspora rosea]|uniref:Aquaporin-like protein n=1 Tax=Gigaspora rosea TaxID=44941 RepID=A0A397UZ34_9GLOM|nr:aquaporin-like protein [Gigaspora rosea]